MFVINNLQNGLSQNFLVNVFKAERIDKIYYILAILRFILTLTPQKGYIHPDEFFQSIEVMAGNVFNFECNKPWEFNQTFPIRSIFAPYLLTGIPYKFMRQFDSIFQSYFDVTFKTPYWLTVIPRLNYCLLSFALDYCLYKICSIHYQKYKGKLMLLASSYVVMVYGTHTFSNSVEMVLMAILLYLVTDSHTYSYAVVKQDQFLKKKYDESEKAIDRARLYKIKASLPSHTLRHCIFISFIVTTGVFNRPTFIAFAFPCVFFWIYRGIGYKIVTLTEIHLRMVLFVLNCILFSCLFVVIDSFYFGYLTGIELFTLDISINNFIITPLNFVKYNMDVNKLAEHGLHPRFLHLLVNVPILYNILGITAVCTLIVFFVRITGRFRSLPSIYDIRCLMTVAIFFPIAILSYFPHQEPRFLIPITLPIIYLYGDYIVNRKYLLRLWWLFNAISLFFFGFVHQAGVLSLASHLHQELQSYKQINLVTSNIYSFPVSLLAQKSSSYVYGTGASKYVLPKTVILHELGSKSPESIVHNLKVIHYLKSNSNRVIQNAEIFLAMPLSEEYELMKHVQSASAQVYIERISTFYPHISTEAMPHVFHCYSEDCDISYLDYITNVLYNILHLSGLGLYKVNYN